MADVGEEDGRGESEQSPAEMIQSLDNDLDTFKGCVQSIGTQFDDPQNRAELKRLRGVIKDKIANTDRKLMKFHKDDPLQRMKEAKLLRDQIKQFNDLLESEKTATKQNRYPLGTDASSLSYSENQGADTSSLVQTQTGIGALAVREREAEELRDLEIDILDLQAIQMEVAGLITEQGEDIDRLEVQAERAQGRVERAVNQTEDILEIRKRNTKIKLIVGGLIAGVVIILVVVLIIVLAVFVPRAQ